VRITVEDDGPGVPDETLPRLFEKFYRVPGQSDGARRGMGIGMSIVKGLVEAMGGTVSARRGELGGLAVDILLPAAPMPVAATA
jgi:signal transduction histidine kinase